MCFDLDSSPPIPHVHGGAVAHADLTLTADDGNEFAAFEAMPDRAEPAGDTAILILPDVRGLFHFYEELALRFAEHGFQALAIDYFGRTAGVSKRSNDWDYMPEVRKTTIEGVTADVRAGIAHLRGDNPNRSIFIVGFCFGGSNSWHMAASGLDLSGVVGFYGHPERPGFPIGAPSIMSRIEDFSCPVLALQGGDDPGIPVEFCDAFADAIASAGKPGEVVVYEDAPHSFFDRKQDEFADASADAWDRIQAFIAEHA